VYRSDEEMGVAEKFAWWEPGSEVQAARGLWDSNEVSQQWSTAESRNEVTENWSGWTSFSVPRRSAFEGCYIGGSAPPGVADWTKPYRIQ